MEKSGHCATSWKIAGSVPDEVIEIFHFLNPSGQVMALRSTHFVTEMRTKGIALGRGGGVAKVGLKTLPPLFTDFIEFLGALSFWDPKDLPRPVVG